MHGVKVKVKDGSSLRRQRSESSQAPLHRVPFISLMALLLADMLQRARFCKATLGTHFESTTDHNQSIRIRCMHYLSRAVCVAAVRFQLHSQHKMKLTDI